MTVGWIIVNVILAAALISALLWMLGHHGIRRGVHYDRRAMLRTRMLKAKKKRDFAA